MMDMLKQKGIVRQVEAGRSAWAFTEVGHARLRISQPIKCQGPALALRKGIQVDKASTFELLIMLGE